MRTQAVQGNNYNPQFGMAIKVKEPMDTSNPLYKETLQVVNEINANPAYKNLKGKIEVMQHELYKKVGGWFKSDIESIPVRVDAGPPKTFHPIKEEIIKAFSTNA